MAQRVHPFVRFAAIPVLLSLVLAACAQQAAPGGTSAPTAAATAAPTAAPTPAGPTGTLTIAMRGDVENTHPYLGYDIVGISYRENVFDGLVEWGYDGQVVPGLAESWKVEGLNITFNLRKGVKFHNGDDLTAADVKFSIETLKSPELKSASASNVAAIQEVKVVNDSTVQFVLSKVDARLFDVLANNVSIVPAKYYQSVGQSGFIAKPIGTGPFKFVSWAKDDKLVMEANEGYWNGSYKGKARVKTLIFRPIPTAATRVAELKSGGADIVQDVPPDQVDPLKSAGFDVVESKSPVYQWAFFNTTSDKGAILKDAKVRQALNLAVDMSTIIKTVLGGHAVPLSGGITDLTLGYTSSVKPFTQDQNKAKDLLKQAGYPSGFDLEADITDTQKPDLAQAVIAQLGQVGVKVKLNTLTTAVFNDRWIKKQLDPLYFVTWNTFTHPALLDLLAGCKGFISSFCSSEAQPFLDQGGGTLDQGQQKTAYEKAVDVFGRDPFALYLSGNNNLTGVSKKVQGWKPHGITVVLGTNAAVSK